MAYGPPTHSYMYMQPAHTHIIHTHMHMHTLIQLQPCSLNVHILFIKACPHSLHLILGPHITSLPSLFFSGIFPFLLFLYPLSFLFPLSSPPAFVFSHHTSLSRSISLNMYKYRVIQKLCNLNKHATIKLIIGIFLVF